MRKGLEPERSRLFSVAGYSLAAEDASLRQALQSTPSVGRERLEQEQYNLGLACKVFETTLAYEIFKAWLPMAAVGWEESYPGESSKADLVVYSDVDRVAAVVEVKWWLADFQKWKDLLIADIKKLRRWKGTEARYLMSVWWNEDTPSAWQREVESIESFCREDGGVQPVFLSTFPTETWHARQSSKSTDFALLFMEVSAG